MKKLLLVVSASILLCACENVDSRPNPTKSNRDFSNIDNVVRRGYKQNTSQKITEKKAPLNHTSHSTTKVNSRTTAPIYYNHPNYSSLDFNEIAPKTKEAYLEDSVEIVENKNGENGGYFKVGNPYEIEGVSYFPQNYEDFEETGTASWYGPDFHGNKTANGETYDSFTMTAAHPTLPMPSMVRVTNLRNGKSVIVRVNDRGPFSKSRIIDVSEKAADELGFKDEGTTEVRIQLLRDETEEMLKKLNVKEKK